MRKGRAKALSGAAPTAASTHVASPVMIAASAAGASTEYRGRDLWRSRYAKSCQVRRRRSYRRARYNQWTQFESFSQFMGRH
jgi:hypothetical protein